MALAKILFEPLMRWSILLFDRLYFRAHHWHGQIDDFSGPVLLVANHFSWWDGLWVMLRFGQTRWQLAVPMLESQLQSRPFLRWWGARPLRAGKSLPLQIQACRDACSKQNQLLLLFPQGQIASLATGHFSFQTGMLRKLLQPGIQLVFLYQTVEYGNQPRPEVHHFLAAQGESIKPADIEAAYNHFVEQCRWQLAAEMQQNMERL